MASLAEYGRELIRDRTYAGLQSERARGRTGEIPKEYPAKTLSKPILLRSIYKHPTMRLEDIYKPLGLTRATFYRYAKILDHHTDQEIKKWELKNYYF